MQDPVHCERIVRFGIFELDIESEELRRNGLKLKLSGQPFQVLAILLERPGRVVTREELQKRLWPDTFVDVDHNLNTAINKIREVLGDSAETPRFVETLPRRGYRFIGPASSPHPNETVAEGEVDEESPGEVAGVDSRKSSAERTRPHLSRPLLWVFVGLSAIVLTGSLLVVLEYQRRSHSSSTSSEAPLQAVPLTAYPGLALQPSFSPDGNEVAFSWDGEKQNHYEIYRKLIDQGEPLRLNTGSMGGHSPAWSPDGRFIAYYRSSGASLSRKYVCVIPALGGPERQLAEVGAQAYSRNFPHATLTWTHDGKSLIVPDRDGQPGGLFLLSLESGEMRRLTSTKRWDEFPSLSPDGRTLAFVRALEIGNQDVYLLSLAEGLQAQGEPKRLTYENRLVESPVWTRDGKEILFSSGGFWGERSIRRIAVGERGSPSSYRPRATSFGEDATTLSISSTTDRLVYTRLSEIVNIYRLELSADGHGIGTPQRVTASSRVNFQPNFSPDGKRLTFTSTRTGNQEIWVTDADGLNPRQMSSVGGALTSDSSWSPDGKTIVFDSRWRGLSDIYVVDVDGGPPRALTNGHYNNYWPTWSRDGKWIYFMSDRSGGDGVGVYRMPAGGGDAIQLAPNGSWGFPFESADGKWIYLCARRGGLWKIPIGGGNGVRVMESISDYLNYVIVNNGVYSVEESYGSNAPASIHFFDFATRKTKLVIKTGKPISLGLAVSPDQRWLLFTEVEHLGSDLMLVDNFR
jgi:Tol biopolymer transport system component/DNA-binding winged helix-turn-helix (wHTH) protein